MLWITLRTIWKENIATGKQGSDKSEIMKQGSKWNQESSADPQSGKPNRPAKLLEAWLRVKPGWSCEYFSIIWSSLDLWKICDVFQSWCVGEGVTENDVFLFFNGSLSSSALSFSWRVMIMCLSDGKFEVELTNDGMFGFEPAIIYSFKRDKNKLLNQDKCPAVMPRMLIFLSVRGDTGMLNKEPFDFFFHCARVYRWCGIVRTFLL